MAVDWLPAKSIIVLRDQVNAAAPNRDKSSDGIIGDAAHAASASDHNPLNGVVHAIDITHDVAHGVDSGKLAEHMRGVKDPRIKYVISNRRIFGDTGYGKRNNRTPWTWYAYHGTNPHDMHVHVSVNAATGDQTQLWDIGEIGNNLPATPTQRVLKKGMVGPDVAEVQKLLMNDGIFGPATEAAVQRFQREQGLQVDGIVGAATWAALDTLTEPQPPPPDVPGEILFQTQGKMSTFGGPEDMGVAADEGLAIYNTAAELEAHGVEVLSAAEAGAPELARRLDPTGMYVACRWDYAKTPKAFLQDAVATVTANGKTVAAKPVDWGPNVNTGRNADLSPGAADHLGLQTDDECTVTIRA